MVYRPARSSQSGNVLFLILIAVALFAALSYAVSLSMRGTGSGAQREENDTSSGVILAFGDALKVAVQRMVTVNAILVDDLEFNPPADFSNCTSPSVCVFHPDGGQALYQTAPTPLMDMGGDNSSGTWVITANMEVQNMGTSGAASVNGNDVVAFLVGIRKDICESINRRLGLPYATLPQMANQAAGADMITSYNSYYMDYDVVPAAEFYIIGSGGGDAALAGEQAGCYYESQSGNYVYYTVVYPR